jgi:hypothetical protein
MDVLIILFIFAFGSGLFVVLFYGVAKLYYHKKMHNPKKKYMSLNRQP